MLLITRNREKEHLPQSYIDFGNIPGKTVYSLIYDGKLYKLVVAGIIWGVKINIKHNSYNPRRCLFNHETRGDVLTVSVTNHLFECRFCTEHWGYKRTGPIFLIWGMLPISFFGFP